MIAEKSLESASFLFPTGQPCPFDLYRDLRAQAPVLWSEQMRCFVVSTYDLIQEVIRDTATFTSRGTQNAIVNESVRGEIEAIRATGWPIVPFLVTNDPPEHGAYRKLVSKLFDARRMRAMQAGVDARVAELMDPLVAAGGGDVMTAIAVPLPVMVIADLLGVPAADWPTFRGWGDAYVEPMNGTLSPEREIFCAHAMRAYQDYFVAAIEARRAAPRDDLISELVHAELPGHGRTMDIPELLSAIQQFLVAGGETTTYALGSCLMAIAGEPGLAERLRGDASAQATFVEETLRLRAPSQGIYRIATRDTVLAGVAIPAGSVVNVRLAAANRDEAVFAEAERMDCQRANAARHLSFGSGIHTCMGAQLARMEIAAGVSRALATADWRINDAAGGAQWIESVFFMGLHHLHLAATPR